MTKNPLLNALAATAYITLISTMLNIGSKFAPHPDNKFLAPIGFLSLFTLSAAVMGYIFCYQPFTLFMDNKKKAAAKLFVQTMGAFAAITVVVLTLIFSGLVK